MFLTLPFQVGHLQTEIAMAILIAEAVRFLFKMAWLLQMEELFLQLAQIRVY